MSSVMFRSILTATFVAAASLAAAVPVAAQEECAGSVNFEEVDIRTVITEFASRTGYKFVVDPRVDGTVTIKSGPNGGLCADEAWELFQAALRVSGFTAAPINGDSYKIIPIQDGARAASPVGEARAGNYVTQIVRLKFIDAREAAATLTQITSERGVVSPVRTGNALILVDVADNIERIERVIAEIDQDTTVYRTIALENLTAIEAAGIVSDLAREISEESAGQRAPVQVVPVEATNSLLVRAEPIVLARITRVIAELDRVGVENAGLNVITLRHADAVEMAELLREIAAAQPAPEANPGNAAVGAASAQARTNITADPATNSIIISGGAAIQKTLSDVVARLDLRRAQVQVEAVIVEVSEGTARELGLQYFLSGDGSENGRVPFTATNFQSAQPNVLAAAGAFLLEDERFGGDALEQAALTSLLGTNGLLLGGAGALSDGSVFGAILTALQEDDESRVLALPSVTTLDNQPARLSVGQEIPITTGEAVGDNFTGGAFRTVSREEVGTILEVTPRITEGDTVTLEISQETSSVVGQIISTSTDLITNKRTIETRALVDNGDILVIGGLIDQNEQYLDSQVPLLGDIPVFGNLFKTQARSRDRRNLMVFIKPTILRDRDSARSATTKKLDYIRARELLSSDRPYSEIDRLIEQTTGLSEE
ncbi:MAG: type II secretion system secretin GspD [Pseudomonadota bacterium]